MRRFLSVCGIVIGVLIALVGGAAAVWVGPDDTLATGPHHVSSAGHAVVTAPGVLAKVGPTLHVSAAGPRPAFVGIGHDADVTSYIGPARHDQVHRLNIPWSLDTDLIGAPAGTLRRPGDADFWVAHASGPGAQAVAFPLTDGAWDIVLMNADGSQPVALDVTMGLEVGGAFYTALGVCLAGVLLVVGGVLLFRRRRPSVVTPPPLDGAGPAWPPGPRDGSYDQAHAQWGGGQ
jgi:hypothetical protein